MIWSRRSIRSLSLLYRRDGCLLDFTICIYCTGLPTTVNSMATSLLTSVSDS
ncbi:hypothetical protein HYDPIDRAFT_108374 [Hydnomerulius pinastri MD-312]|nr:hypothetical protein HYDPIDRAFT_108374 [Hydnomerulius pinastri MD-312]